MAEKTIAPSIVQNLNMASDLYGDRSNIRNPYDTGVQIFTVNGSNQFVPQRALNTHLLAGETELRPEVGTNFVATFNWSSFLPKGFASDQFYYAVTSIGLSILNFGKVTATTGTSAVMSSATITVDRAAQGVVAALAAAPVAGDAVAVQYPGQLLAQLARATFGGAWMEYKQDGRKTSFVFDHMLNIPSTTQFNDASALGLSLQSNRAMLPVPFLLSPRNTNQSQEVVLLHFENLNPVADLSFNATAGDEYALVYKLDFGGYFCDAQGNPAEQEFTLANARLAADYRPVGG